MAKFEVISPNGKKIEIEGEQFPTEKELDEIFKSFDNSDSGLSNSPTKPATQKKEGRSKLPKELFNFTPSHMAKNYASTKDAELKTLFNLARGKYDFIKNPNALKELRNDYNAVYDSRYKKLTNPVTDTAVDIAGYALLPQGKVTAGAKWLTKLGALAKTGAIQGAPVALIESLKEKGLNPVENIKDTATGTAIGAGANPVVSGIVSKTAKAINNDTTKNAVSSLVEILTSVPKKYTKLALDNEIAGTSIFKDPKKFDADSAYIPIERKLKEAKATLPDEKYYRSEFQKLGSKAEKALNNQFLSDEEIARRQYDAGQKILKGYETAKAEAEERIQKALNSLPEKAIDKAQLMKDLNDIINSFKRGGTVNIPAIRAKKDINELYDILGLSENSSFGAAYPEYSNLPKEAIDSLLQIKDGYVPNAITKEGLGGIDFVYGKRGKKGYGLAHIVERRGGEGINVQEFLDNIPELIEKGEVFVREGHPGRKYIINKNNEAVIRLDWDGEKRNWLASAYKKEEAPLSASSDRSATHVLGDKLDAGDGVISSPTPDNTIISDKNSNLNPRNLLDLHNVKEDLYDRTIYDNEAGTSVNEVRKALAGKINKTLRDVSPEYAKANDAYAALKKAEYALGGINESTIGKKVSDYNTKDQILSGKDRALRDFEQFLPDENKFISEIKSLQDIKNNQDRIRSNIPSGIFKNLSAMEKNPAAAAELIGIDAAAPSNLQFMDDYRKLLSQEAIQKEMMKRIGSKAYEKNPRLLANFSDEGGEEALKYLQEKSGVNFIDDLEKIRAREALEYGMPGQGGGSGSDQGFGNLVRTSIAGAGAPITKGLSILAVSPKIAGQGTVKNLGRIHNLAEKIVSNPESMESKAANVIPLASILKQIIANDTQSQRRNGEINADVYRYRY